MVVLGGKHDMNCQRTQWCCWWEWHSQRWSYQKKCFGKKEKTTNFKIVTTSGLGRMGGNWVLNGVLTCGALAQALLGQQLQHREAMTSCQEQRFEMEERPLAVLVRNAIKQGAKICQNGWRLDTKDDLVMAPLGHLFVKKIQLLELQSHQFLCFQLTEPQTELYVCAPAGKVASLSPKPRPVDGRVTNIKSR